MKREWRRVSSFHLADKVDHWEESIVRSVHWSGPASPMGLDYMNRGGLFRLMYTPNARPENIMVMIWVADFGFIMMMLAEVFAKDGLSFLASCQNLVSRPWVIDDLDSFKTNWAKKSWKKAIIFVDNSGADIVLGILPFARELLKRGTQVVLAANDLPSINDVTYPELVEIISKLKDEKGQLVGVDASGLLVANSGNDLPVIDLANVSPELAYLASDADLVVLEGMGRSIETNLYAQMKCDSVKIGMVVIAVLLIE
ncbi:uncharacterized protein At2g17340 [Dendrobium catenatum]|uniref:uncharacterized protein At2g17340 n=1 Tax=Dendrobium catenatum TaxID=906689 RepID=UPI0010A08FED|nr:uncharacterized protein At2g17340 [Dendrobium catenatum]